MSFTATERRRAHAPALAKVPAITALFWVIKLMTTGMGEACSDWLGGISIPLAGAVGLIGMAVTLFLQLRSPKYNPALYWATVSMVAVFGTMAADGVHVVLGIPYPITTTAYILAVAACFAVWHKVEGTLDIHSITTKRRELFYWATVLATFALGTAAGDFTAATLHLGYLPSAILFGVLILIPLLGWRFAGLNTVVAFWAAYVLTRPLGASLADWVGKPHSKGNGLGVGDGPVTIALIVLIIAVVTWSVKSGRDKPAEYVA